MNNKVSELIKNSRMLILPTRPLAPFHETETLNKTFQAWKSAWKDVETSTQFKFNEDEFFRQDAVLTLLSPEDEILGLHLYSFFNLCNECSTNFSYFNSFSPEYKNFLLRNNIINSFSAEYLTVCKKFRRNGELSLAKSIISLSCHFLEQSPFDGMLAKTRNDVNVNLMSQEFGGEIISEGFKINGIKSSHAVFQKEKTLLSDNLLVRSFVKKIWEKRSDYTSLSTSSSQKIKKEAA